MKIVFYFVITICFLSSLLGNKKCDLSIAFMSSKYKNPSSTKYKNLSFTKYKNLSFTKYKNLSFTTVVSI
jgi:hypothetical protein